MQETPEHDDPEALRQAQATEQASSREHELRARSQAALVRESLVRCPGAGEPAVNY